MRETLDLVKSKLSELCLDDVELSESLDILERKVELYMNIEKCLYDSELYLVYKHTAPNGKVYIGITRNHPQTRWHDGGGYDKQTKFYRAIQKYGWINFKHEILAAGLSEEDAKRLERKLIIEAKSYDKDFGYNTKVSILEFAQHAIVDESITVGAMSKNITRHKTDKSSVDISKELVAKFDIMFIFGTLYYRENGCLISEAEKPMLNKVLLDEYNIPLRKHPEILEQVKILCSIDEKNLSHVDSQKIFTQTNSIVNWIQINNLEAKEMTNRPSCDWYDDYVKWAKMNKIQDIKGKKQFYKYITNEFNFTKKQRADGKRYFCIIE